MSDSLWLHGLQHARLPCPSPSPRVFSNSCPLSQGHYLSISSSVILFSSCPQSFPSSRSFPVSRLFVSGGQSIGASALASVLPTNIQGWFPLGLTGLISLQSKGLSRVFSSTTVWKHQFFRVQPSLGFPGGSDGKESACNAGDLGSTYRETYRLERSPGEGHGNPFPYSCLENPRLGKSSGGGHGSPLQYSGLENPHGQRRLVSYSPWGHQQSNMTKRLSTQHTAFSMVQLAHPYTTAGKPQLRLYGSWSAKDCLCFLIHYLGLS